MYKTELLPQQLKASEYGRFSRHPKYLVTAACVGAYLMTTLLMSAFSNEAAAQSKTTPSKGTAKLKEFSVKPNEVKGAPYPEVKPDDFVPNEEQEEGDPIPTGPKVGNMKPANPSTGIKKLPIEGSNKPKKN